MSSISPIDSARSAAARQSSTNTGSFFRNVWESFKRQSELQVMLSTGYGHTLAKDNYIATHFDN